MNFYTAALQSPGADILNLGFLRIRWYGLLIALSILIGIRLSKILAHYRGIDSNFISEILPSLIISSLIGARIYYVIFEYRQFIGSDFYTSINFLNITIPVPSFLAIWEGGIAIHGALLGGLIAIIIFCRSKKIHLPTFLDIILPSVILGQAIGRWGNFFNNEAFGLPTNLPWKLFIPLRNRPLEFLNSQFFHPTFLYESIWNLLIFLILIFIFNRQKKGDFISAGVISCTYVIGYSLGRFWIEGLRIDPLCLGSLPPFCEGGLRIAQFISLFLFSSGLIWLYFLKFKTNIK
tara:strand:- start:151 stop:1026 length:876 start_codon:yes stop_codon:yes gene_type:complete